MRHQDFADKPKNSANGCISTNGCNGFDKLHNAIDRSDDEATLVSFESLDKDGAVF